MTSKVIEFPVGYAGRPENLLADASKAGLIEIIIVAKNKQGADWFASTVGDADTLWRVVQFKKKLIE